MNGADPYLPGHGDVRFHVEHYDLDLQYKVADNHLDAKARVRLTALEPLSEIVLDLHALQVTSLRVTGAAVARWTHRSSRLRIRLRTPVATDAELTVAVSYRGQPRPMPGPDGPTGWEELTDGVLVAAQPHGAPTWFPCNDRMADKATYSVTVRTDPGYRVVSNGTLTAERRVGRRVEWVHEQSEPMSTYLATLQIGRYSVEHQPGGATPTALAAPPARMPSVRLAFADQPRMLETFSALFGPYPFETYTVVVTDDPLEIPLESQTLSAFGTNHLGLVWDNQRLIAHELAHQWFGNTVTAASLRDIWLHEGFACYAEWLWSETIGRTTAQEEAERHHALLARLPQDLVLTDPGPHRTFDDRVYKRGALTLHTLRRAVGDGLFFAVLRAWVDVHRYGVVTTADFEELVRDETAVDPVALLGPWLRERALPPLVPAPASA
ncbi:MAG TPA: M1 family metallopeptidase [Ornithinibacter sp.]|nr:M1 family metallopeptidase [Ornithinibacter sp.]